MKYLCMIVFTLPQGHTQKNQIASLLFCEEDDIQVRFMDVQRQSGTMDCGLFAVAFATCLSSGVQPGTCTIKQQNMRKHLYQCLQISKMDMFPIIKCRRGPIVKSSDIISVYCVCCMPECSTFGIMVKCSICEKWYHVSCVCVSRKVVEDPTN